MENLTSLNRRQAVGGILTGLSAPFVSTASFADELPVLVELFTSQGCSSCPAADKLAGELSSQPGVTVVSLNVDYWDYLGWRDTLASPANTKRQMDYAHARGDNNVYTPQMVINGSAHVVGSNNLNVQKAIAAARSQGGNAALNLTSNENSVKFELAAGLTKNATLRVMAISPAIEVKIGRGENSGKTIVYHNVVRKISDALSWNAQTHSIVIPRKDIVAEGGTSFVAVLQEENTGPTIGFSVFS